jgi:ATP-dependent helicase/nuclease subunit A
MSQLNTQPIQQAAYQAAYQADGRNVNAASFYAIACDPRRSVVVEACAGAGKTWMLVSRMLRALLDGAQPQDILAITFTRKAAGEMRARLNDWLAEFAAPACTAEHRIEALTQRGMSAQQAREFEPALATLQERVLSGGRPVEIRTFHAWFSQLLRAAPLDMLAEQGLQADMTLIEDLSEHLPAVYRRFHAAVLNDEALRADFDAQVLLRGRSQLRKWLDGAWQKRIEIELADAAGHLESSVPDAAAQWRDFVGLAHPHHRVQAPDIRGLMLSVAAELGAQTGAVPRKQGSLLEQAMGEGEAAVAFKGAWAALFTQKGELRKKLDVPGLDEAAACLVQIQQATDQQAAHEEHLRMVRLARVLIQQFALYKRSRGLADMPDLERCALALLRDSNLSGWLQERLDSRIRHVMVDEFQDTSPLQWQALHAWLSAYAGAGGGSSGQRPPGVFIVGDPKQSIYRFRRAEPRVFVAAREFVLTGLQGHVLECDHTRRNAPVVLSAVNAVFEQAQASEHFQGFRPHTTGIQDADVIDAKIGGVYSLPRTLRPLKSERGGTLIDALVWRDSLTTPRHLPEEALRQQEARQVALAVRELVVTRGVPPGDIYIVSRKRASLRWVAQELAALHLPRAAAEASPLMNSPPVRDLVAVLDVLASNVQNLSLAQALRSPLFGASDADLMQIAGAAARSAASAVPGTTWWAALMSLTPHDNTSPALQRAQTLLQAWREAAQHLPPHDLLDRVVAEGEFRERTAAALPPERRGAALSAIDALLGLSLSLDGARYATPYNFVRALKRGALKLPLPSQPDAVQLLTVHGAKGLEAPVVFVMDADPEPQRPDSASVLVEWPVEADAPTRCAFVYSESAAKCPPSLLDVLAVEAAAREREELNSLYVAMTRARKCLVFSATEPHRTTEGMSWWQRIESLAQAWVPASVADAQSREKLLALNASATQMTLLALPHWTGSRAASVAPRMASESDSALSRLGQAFHRVMEWATAPHVVVAAAPMRDWCVAAAREFGLSSAAVEELTGVVNAVLSSPNAQRFFSGSELLWAGNEVSVPVLGDDGPQALRIDRLVALHDPSGASGSEQARVWWVLDYKLHPAPHTVPEHCAQLLRYRDAVRGLQAPQTVHCAFITGAGEVIALA